MARGESLSNEPSLLISQRSSCGRTPDPHKKKEEQSPELMADSLKVSAEPKCLTLSAAPCSRGGEIWRERLAGDAALDTGRCPDSPQPVAASCGVHPPEMVSGARRAGFSVTDGNSFFTWVVPVSQVPSLYQQEQLLLIRGGEVVSCARVPRMDPQTACFPSFARLRGGFLGDLVKASLTFSLRSWQLSEGSLLLSPRSSRPEAQQ